MWEIREETSETCPHLGACNWCEEIVTPLTQADPRTTASFVLCPVCTAAAPSGSRGHPRFLLQLRKPPSAGPWARCLSV